MRGVVMANNRDEHYLETKIDAVITKEQNQIGFIFEQAKLNMSHLQEIELIKVIDSELNKRLTLSEDRLIIEYELPESYSYFDVINEADIRTKLQFAYNIVKKVENHSLKRLNLCICPDNIIFDQGLKPFFLHYGVKESLPPYQPDNEVIWLETKATVASILDNQYDFSTYLAHHETKELSELTYKIMAAASYDDLLTIIRNQIIIDDEYEQTVIHITEKKWKVHRYLIVALTVLLVPLFIYSSFVLFFKLPEKDAYIDGNYYFQNDEYSSVIQTLDKYQPDQMPKIVQYQLALSYLVNESLTEVQRANIENTLTLQSNSNYFLYWINIGRGNYQEAIDTARILEDRDLIVYGLLKEREKVKADQTFTGQEREENIKKIQEEIDEYQREIEEEAIETDPVQEKDNLENDLEDEINEPAE